MDWLPEPSQRPTPTREAWLMPKPAIRAAVAAAGVAEMGQETWMFPLMVRFTPRNKGCKSRDSHADQQGSLYACGEIVVKAEITLWTMQRQAHLPTRGSRDIHAVAGLLAVTVTLKT